MQTEIMKLDQVVVVDENKARTNPKSQTLKELAASIKEMGVLQPILVTDYQAERGKVVVVAGRRRLAAAKLAGLNGIPVIRIVANKQTASEIAVIENLQREDLPPLEEAAEIGELLAQGWDTKDIADHIGKSPTWVVRRAALSKLSPEWQKALADPKHSQHGVVSHWPAGYLELVARLSVETQDLILQDAWEIDSREDLERWCNQETQLLSKAPWKKSDGTLLPVVGPCYECTKRSSHQPGLFDEWGLDPKELKKTDKCLDSDCWGKKAQAYIERREVELREEHDEVIRVKNHYATKGAFDKHAITKKKQKEKGAKPCIVVDGPDAGRVFYGQVAGWAKSSSNSRSTTGKKAGPSPLKERREKLNHRREALVNKWLCEKLQDDSYPKMAVGRYSLAKLLHHLMVFGTGMNMVAPGPGAWKEKQLSKDKVLANLWAAVFDVLDERIHFNGNPPAKEHEALCKEHGDLFNVTIKGLREKAAKEIPEPKSWAGLNADGTPKKKAAKKAKKKK